MHYKHTQIGRLMIFASIAVVILFGAILSTGEFEIFMISMMIFIVVLMFSFSTLEVTIDGTFIKIKFGYGLYSKRFELGKIVSAKAVKNKWYYGWGIRYWMWPPTTIYNVSGFDAVEIVMKDGKRIRIGTDEPKQLEQALTQVLSQYGKST